MKWVHRTIVTSDTYQRSWRPNETNGRDETNFSRCVPRRLPAEVVFDSITLATASDTAIDEIHQNLEGRAIAIPGASNRASNTGTNYALTVFGKSTRETNCDCDRSMEPSLLQTVFLQNDSSIHQTINRRNTGWLDQLAQEHNLNRPAAVQSRRPQQRRPSNFKQQVEKQKKRLKAAKEAGNEKLASQIQTQLNRYMKRFVKKDSGAAGAAPQKANVNTAEMVQQAYLRTLSRYPDQREMERSLLFVEQSDDTLNGIRGLLWALLNTKEFIVNH